MGPTDRCSKTSQRLPAPSLPGIPLLRQGLALPPPHSPPRQPHRTGWHLGGPSARLGPRGNEAKGKCPLAPSLPLAGAVGSFRAAVAMQPCLFEESVAEAGSSAPAAGPGACPPAWGWPGVGPPHPCPLGPLGRIGHGETTEPGFLQ